MDWRETRIEYSQHGQTWIVGRPALVMEFYGRGPELAPRGTKILDVCLSAMPREALDQLHVLTSRKYNKLTAAMQRRMQKELSELDRRPRFYAATTNRECAVGEYSFELNLGDPEPRANDLVYLALPLAAADLENAQATRALFVSMLHAGPFWGAIAGYGFDCVWGREFEMRTMPVNYNLACRLHGLLVRDRMQSLALPDGSPHEALPRPRIPSVAWLTYLGGPLLEQLGGDDALLGRAVDSKVAAERIAAGVLMSTGAAPSIGDVNRQDGGLDALRALHRLVEPVVLDEWYPSANLLGVDQATASEWLHRFER